MGRAYAPVQRELDARPGCRAGRHFGHDRGQACRSDQTLARAGPYPRRARRGGFARNLYRAERRSLRSVARYFSSGERGQAHPGFAAGDILYDLAFLLMDLEESGLRPAANRLFNRYLAPASPSAIIGLAALPLFMSLRAAIRAKVEAAGSDRLQGDAQEAARALARRYFGLAQRLLHYQPPRLVAIGGLSGAGKSALAGVIAPKLGRPPGALWLRSDVERKAMFGVEETERLPESAYIEAASRAVYRRIEDKTREALRAGHTVILDATFASGFDRAQAAGAAAEIQAAFRGVFLDAPLATRLLRVAGRRNDASDADVAVASRQTAEPLREPGWAELDASGDLEQTTALTLARLGWTDSAEA